MAAPTKAAAAQVAITAAAFSIWRSCADTVLRRAYSRRLIGLSPRKDWKHPRSRGSMARSVPVPGVRCKMLQVRCLRPQITNVQPLEWRTISEQKKVDREGVHIEIPAVARCSDDVYGIRTSGEVCRAFGGGCVDG